MKNFIPALLLLLVFSFVSFSQTTKPTATPTPTPTKSDDDDIVKITTTLIQVDAVVTDKNGKIVTDLKPEEFEIYENGQKQNLTNFSFIFTVPEEKPAASPTPKPDKNEVAVPIPPIQIKPEQVRRTITLVVDDLGISFESMHFVRRSLKKFVEEQMQNNDLVAIIRTGGGVGALQQFTTDKNMLLAAIEKISWNPMGRAGIGAFAPLEPTALEQAQANGQEISDEDIQADKERTTAFNELREDLFAVGTLGAINFVVKGMNELPGRKSIILFSDGFSICTETDIKNDPDRCSRMRDEMKQLTDFANRAAVTIYTLDSRGLQTLGITAADSIGSSPTAFSDALRTRSSENWDKQEGLAFLASETGGRSFFNNNDFNKSIDRALEDQKGFYLLGYQPDSDSFDPIKRKFNKLVIKVTRPGVNVRYRSGFFGVVDRTTPRPSTQSPQQQIEAALVSPFAVNGISLKLNTLFGYDQKNGAYTKSLLHINASDLQFTDEVDGKRKATFDVMAAAFGENGTPIDFINKNYTLTVSKDIYQKILAEGFVYNFMFPIKKPGSFQMRVAIRDSASTKIGSASQFVEAPDIKKKKLTLSGIVLENFTLDQWKQTNDPKADANLRLTNPLSDTSLRRFKKGTVLRYASEIYNAKLERNSPKLETRIRVFRNGKLFFDRKAAPFEPTGPATPGKFTFVAAMSLGTEIPVGDYVLQVVVVDTLAKKKNQLATQWVQFEVVDK